MSLVFVTSQSSCFFLCSREQIRQVENMLNSLLNNRSLNIINIYMQLYLFSIFFNGCHIRLHFSQLFLQGFNFVLLKQAIAQLVNGCIIYAHQHCFVRHHTFIAVLSRVCSSSSFIVGNVRSSSLLTPIPIDCSCSLLI